MGLLSSLLASLLLGTCLAQSPAFSFRTRPRYNPSPLGAGLLMKSDVDAMKRHQQPQAARSAQQDVAKARPRQAVTADAARNSGRRATADAAGAVARSPRFSSDAGATRKAQADQASWRTRTRSRSTDGNHKARVEVERRQNEWKRERSKTDWNALSEMLRVRRKSKADAAASSKQQARASSSTSTSTSSTNARRKGAAVGR